VNALAEVPPDAKKRSSVRTNVGTFFDLGAADAFIPRADEVVAGGYKPPLVWRGVFSAIALG
jgi:hypothetical protein